MHALESLLCQLRFASSADRDPPRWRAGGSIATGLMGWTALGVAPAVLAQEIAPAAEDVAPAAEEIAPAAPAAVAPAAVATEPVAGLPAVAVPGEQAPTVDLGAVAVTGTAIARTDAATALPVTVIEAEDIRQQGITSTAQLLEQLPTNDTSAGPGLGTGSAITAGAAFADLRGLGPNKTLVLLNGRRLGNNAFDGGAVDLNSIPLGVIERVEVLRDGASALYGTDAIGGVINFITKKELEGGDFGFTYEVPTRDGGGNRSYLSLTAGHGDLEREGFNVLANLTYRGQDEVAVRDRDGIIVPYDPDRGVFSISSFPYPANYYQGNLASNPAAAAGCALPGLIDTGTGTCSYDFSRWGEVVPERDDLSAYGRADIRLAPAHQATLSYLWTHNESLSIGAPAPTSTVPQLQPGTPFFPGGGLVPDPLGIDPTLPVGVRWRGVPGGRRLTENTNDLHRAVIDFSGRLGAFRYDSALSYNRAETELDYLSGYLDDSVLEAAFNAGTINPFSTAPLTPAGRQALNAAVVTGVVQEATGEVVSWDGNLTRSIGDWFGAGQAAMALGALVRHEQLELEADEEIAARASSGGLSPEAAVDESRDVEGVYAEINVPLTTQFEVTGALRYDHYSDAGSTTNPKVSFRFQPARALVLRGAYSEGFRAPTLYELYDPAQLTFSPGGFSDPLLCPGGTPAAGGVAARDCNTQFQRQLGGNEDLDPEKAKNLTLGAIVQPIDALSLGADFWFIKLEDQINALPVSLLFDRYEQYEENFVRAPDGTIDYVETRNINLGETLTNGFDLSANLSVPSRYGIWAIGAFGTYVNKYDYQRSPDQDFIDNVDVYSDSVIFRWKHRVTFSWTRGPASASLVSNYLSDYVDYDPAGNREVSDYTPWDAFGSYLFANGVGLTVGLRNLFDEDPPFSNQPDVGQPGYDARYADAYGRSIYGRLEYAF